MPIKFRCPHCQQFLGISRAKAGLVTDCPTCGRTIRVPNLDGSVQPLPTPKLNLADAGLRDALEALATLESEEPAEPIALATVPQPSAGKAVVVPPPRDALPPPVAVVLVPEPAPAPSHAPAVPEVNVAKALNDLAAAASPAPVPRPLNSSRGGIGGGVLILSVVGAFLAGTALGYVVGTQATASSGSEETLAAADPEITPGNPPPLTPAANPGSPTVPAAGNVVSGHLTYAGPSGDQLNDAGARILILPGKLPGSSRLPVAGFRAGASEADRKLAEAAVEAIGGKFTVADKTGRFRVELPAANYHLLIMSRYSPREEETALISDVQQLTRDFFDSPQLLVGQVNYHYQKVTLAGSGLAVDHTF